MFQIKIFIGGNNQPSLSHHGWWWKITHTNSGTTNGVSLPLKFARCKWKNKLLHATDTLVFWGVKSKQCIWENERTQRVWTTCFLTCMVISGTWNAATDKVHQSGSRQDQHGKVFCLLGPTRQATNDSLPLTFCVMKPIQVFEQHQ